MSDTRMNSPRFVALDDVLAIVDDMRNGPVLPTFGAFKARLMAIQSSGQFPQLNTKMTTKKTPKVGKKGPGGRKGSC
jgi:hypothetical protein